MKRNACAALVCLSFVMGLPCPGMEGPADPPPTPLETGAKIAVETVLSFVLETRVTAERVRLDADTERFELLNLRIANPKAFDSETPAIAVKRILLEAPPDVLFAPDPVVRVVEVSGAVINADADLRHGINLKKLLDSAARFKGPKPDDQKKWVIEKGLLRESVVNLTTELLVQQTREYKLKPIEMTLKDKDGGGLTADQAISRVLRRILDEIGALGAEGSGNPLADLLRGSVGLPERP